MDKFFQKVTDFAGAVAMLCLAGGLIMALLGAIRFVYLHW